MAVSRSLSENRSLQANRKIRPQSKKRVPLEDIYNSIRDRIGLLGYPPGTVLREGELANEFGVSRTPIREVLHRLTFDGLVEAKNGVGTIVTSVDYGYFKDIYDVRLLIAESIGRLSPMTITEAHIAEVEALLKKAQELKAAFDITRYWKLNRQLHDVIASLIGNSALREMWDRHYFKVARVWYGLAPDWADEFAETFEVEVADVLRGLRERDVLAIGYSQRNFISYGMKRVIEHYEGRGDRIVEVIQVKRKQNY